MSRLRAEMRWTTLSSSVGWFRLTAWKLTPSIRTSVARVRATMESERGASVSTPISPTLSPARTLPTTWPCPVSPSRIALRIPDVTT